VFFWVGLEAIDGIPQRLVAQIEVWVANSDGETVVAILNVDEAFRQTFALPAEAPVRRVPVAVVQRVFLEYVIDASHTVFISLADRNLTHKYISFQLRVRDINRLIDPLANP